jgi:CBS domain-containing protein
LFGGGTMVVLYFDNKAKAIGGTDDPTISWEEAMKVKDILKAKGHAVATVRADSSAIMAIKRMKVDRIGTVVVSDAGGRLLGIFSERDVVQALAAQGALALDLPVADLMTRSVVTCSPDQSVAAVMRTMTERRIRHLPVLAEGKLVGIVSIGDVVKNRLEETELESRVLRDAYIASH